MEKPQVGEIQYFRQLDGFRFFSIVAVMITHFVSTRFTDGLPFGFGVLFFFVLSSFLITRILLTAKGSNEERGTNNLFSLKQFYIRRFLRIFPIYYLLITVLYVINWNPCREIIVSLLTYTTNLKIASGFDAANFNHLWSLAVEEQFYIFFPFIVFFINTKYLLRVFIAITCIGLLGRTLLYLHNSTYIPYSNFNTISCLDSLGLGSILAYLSIYKIEMLTRIMRRKAFLIGSAVLFLVVTLVTYSPYEGDARYNFGSMVWMRFCFNIVSFFLLGYSVAVSYRGLFGKILENKIVVYLGRISYGMYLYHLFVPHFLRIVLHHFGKEIPGGWDNVMGIVYMLATVAIASVSWFVIEKPINELKKYFNYNKKAQLKGLKTSL